MSWTIVGKGLKSIWEWTGSKGPKWKRKIKRNGFTPLKARLQSEVARFQNRKAFLDISSKHCHQSKVVSSFSHSFWRKRSMRRVEPKYKNDEVVCRLFPIALRCSSVRQWLPTTRLGNSRQWASLPIRREPQMARTPSIVACCTSGWLTPSP